MTAEQKIIKTASPARGPCPATSGAKVGLLELARQLGNVSRACRVICYSRDSFYRFKELYETGGEAALQEISPLCGR